MSRGADMIAGDLLEARGINQKMEGLATTLTFLGIEHDSGTMEVRLSRERLGREIR